MSEWQDTSRPETAGLHRRIVAAAIRNGHSERSFRAMCLLFRLEGLVRQKVWCLTINDTVFNWPIPDPDLARAS